MSYGHDLPGPFFVLLSLGVDPRQAFTILRKLSLDCVIDERRRPSSPYLTGERCWHAGARIPPSPGVAPLAVQVVFLYASGCARFVSLPLSQNHLPVPEVCFLACPASTFRRLGFPSLLFFFLNELAFAEASSARIDLLSGRTGAPFSPISTARV